VAHRGRQSADEKLAAELAAGKTILEAATAAGVSARTAHRRLEDPKFKAHVAELRADIVRAAAGRLVDGMTEAAGVLRAGLTDADVHVRHKSAVKLIELAVKVAELAELERRVEELEQRFTEGGTG
jgi:hypothetical protein